MLAPVSGVCAERAASVESGALVPRVSINIRPATMEDIPFIDGLQKAHRTMVGWMPRAQLEGYIQSGSVLVAEVGESGQPSALSHQQEPSPPAPLPKGEGGVGLTAESRRLTSAGYIIARDRYFRRDDCGIIYQLNVAPGHRRQLIGAALVQHAFDRAAYGCRLFCCWCAQDIEANRFWESLGFVPLAFRAGSRGKGRVHIFWQRRIRRGDTESPWWYPCQTNAGAIREDRLVLPIPPGTHWSDAKPIVLPRGESAEGEARNARPAALLPAGTGAKQPPAVKPAAAAKRPMSIRAGGLRWAPGAPAQAQPSPASAPAAKSKPASVKNDPRHVAAARELRDRYLEAMDAGQCELPAHGAGKYEIGRLHAAPAARGGLRFEQPPLLDAA